MKRLTFITFILVCIALGALLWLIHSMFFIRSIFTVPITPSSESTKPEPVTNDATVTLDGQTYAYSFFEVRDASDISLIPNFSLKKASTVLMEENNCKKAVSGGFYDKADRPLGLFVVNNNTLRGQVSNSLINGFFWGNNADVVGIGRGLPQDTFTFALQSGPLLIENGSPFLLRIQNDEQARRIVAAKSTKGVIFISVYGEESVFGGSLLGDLPKIVQAISTKENVGIVDAINLDGGSASMFSNGETTLSELTSIGSLFCIK